MKIVYDKDPCKKCGGQIMTIFINNEIIDRRCIKCNNLSIRPRPTCKEEHKGRLMDIYYKTGSIADKRW